LAQRQIINIYIQIQHERIVYKTKIVQKNASWRKFEAVRQIKRTQNLNLSKRYFPKRKYSAATTATATAIIAVVATTTTIITTTTTTIATTAATVITVLVLAVLGGTK
jgi:hypothetical protein